MLHRSRDNQRKFLPKTPTPSSSQPSFLFDDCELTYLTKGELEDPLGEKPDFFEEPMGGEEEPILPTQNMAENGKNKFFPIRETNGEAKIKNISPAALPQFHGLTSEGLDTFMFEFLVAYRTYDYDFDEQKLKLFPSTLKDVVLSWFMILLKDNITHWAKMQQAFNGKYRDYCRSKETKEEIFRMTLGPYESLEDYEEIFKLN